MRTEYFFLCLFVNLCLYTTSGSAQIHDSVTKTELVPAAGDSAVFQKKFFPATVKLMSANIIPFSVNHFIRKVAFADISLHSIGVNLKLRSWEWDIDNFVNNQFSHPYHGSLYFNSFRSEGYSFWQSVPAPFVGSLIWEIAGEVDRPAPNDLVNTTLGGITFGEMTHRLAKRFTRNWRSGKKKNALDMLGIAIDPMEGFSTLLSKKRRSKNVNSLDSSKVDFELSFGDRQYNRERDYQKKARRGEWFTRLNLAYRAQDLELREPFSYFSVMFELGTSDSSVFNMAGIRGSLTGWQLHRSTQRHHFAVLAIVYDYYQNSAFSYGMQSFQMNLFSRFHPSPKITVQTEVGGGVISLAAVSDDELYIGVGRNYGYGSGANIDGMGRIVFIDRLSFSSNFMIGWLKTLNGHNSHYKVHSSTSTIRFQMKNRFFMEYEWGHFFLTTSFVNDFDVQRHNYYKRLSGGYRILF